MVAVEALGQPVCWETGGKSSRSTADCSSISWFKIVNSGCMLDLFFCLHLACPSDLSVLSINNMNRSISISLKSLKFAGSEFQFQKELIAPPKR